MITIPVYDLLLLPGVTFYFKKDTIGDSAITNEQVGEDLLFIMMKSDIPRDSVSYEDIFPIGIFGKIEGIDEEDSVRVSARSRVRITDARRDQDGLHAEIEPFPETEDIDPEDRKQRFSVKDMRCLYRVGRL